MIGHWTLATLQRALGAELGAVLQGDAVFTRVCTDTRSLQPGDLFVALKGPNFDGHRFIAQAREAGAVAAVVESIQDDELPQWQVPDSRIALGHIARLHREQFTGPVYAVTGSSGKTTVKEMLAAILSQQGDVLATHGNLNNDIGAPLTLLSLEAQHQQAVIELGASAGGEIAWTVSLTQPDVAILNNAMGAHLEGFGSLQGVVRAKGEIFSTLNADHGWAIINRDDPHADYWLTQTAAVQRLTFGIENSAADVQAINLQLQADGCYRFELHYDGRSVAIVLPVMGRHMVANALAAAAACLTQQLDMAVIAQGLANVQPVAGRMCPQSGPEGALLIDDSYNANPSAAKAAIDALAALPGERILVLGDMGELGEDAQQLHADVGAYAAQQGIDRLLAKGALSAYTVAGFQQNCDRFTQLFDSHEELIDSLRPLCNAQSRILIKGSRSAAMETVVYALAEGAC